mmetsp:Transcript_4678/g.14600  ORF Transcript_4678/g.14600 Transcript_4678/m.14600 type:complete len:413 (-) Transcript_4678:62-1300(-)
MMRLSSSRTRVPLRRWASSLEAVCRAELEAMKMDGTFKTERVLESAQSDAIRVNGKTCLNFASNNYLGLASDANVIKAAKDGLDARGFGLASVRFIAGTQDIHKRLEARISAFHGTEDAILFPSAFDANAGIFEALLGPEDAVFSDALNHASIIDGIRLCKAKRFRYAHLDLADLRAKLQSCDARVKLIATDGAFSMDGDVAPLAELRAVADEAEAFLLIDECHATGILGRTGRGTPELYNAQPDVITSTLGKALGGGTGGYAAGPSAVVELLRNKARPYLFSNSVSPAVVAASLHVFERRLLSAKADANPVEALLRNTHRFRQGMQASGFRLSGHPDHPIVPVLLDDAKLTTQVADALLQDHGIFVVGFSYPVVPKGAARIRCQISATHTTDQIDTALAAFAAVGTELGLL